MVMGTDWMSFSLANYIPVCEGKVTMKGMKTMKVF